MSVVCEVHVHYIVECRPHCHCRQPPTKAEKLAANRDSAEWLNEWLNGTQKLLLFVNSYIWNDFMFIHTDGAEFHPKKKRAFIWKSWIIVDISY